MLRSLLPDKLLNIFFKELAFKQFTAVQVLLVPLLCDADDPLGFQARLLLSKANAANRADNGLFEFI